MPNSLPIPMQKRTGGRFLRSIRVEATATSGRAELEDEFHRFSADIEHDGRIVTAVNGHSIRYPWTTCPGATAPLKRLVGMQLNVAPDAVYRHTDGRFQCTHLFETAALAIAQASRGAGVRAYEMSVRDPDDITREAKLSCNGETVLVWALEGETVRSQDRFNAMTFREIGAWAAEHGTDALTEPALLLRRAGRLAMGRQIDVDALPDATSLGRPGICHSFQPAIAPLGKRVAGSTRDFDGLDQRPLDDLAGVTRR